MMSRQGALLLALALAHPGCTGERFVVVTAASLPPGAASLEIAVRLDGREARSIAPFDLAAIGGRSDVTFTLALAHGATGLLQVDARALDRGGCALAQGGAEGRVETGRLQVTLAAAPDPCVAIAGVAPPYALTDGKTRVTIRGRGFHPGAVVTVAGRSATGVMVAGNDELSAEVPDVRGQKVFGAVPVRVENPDRTAAQRADLFRYTFHAGFATPIRIDLPAESRGARQLLAADFGGDRRVDLVASGPVVVRNNAERFDPAPFSKRSVTPYPAGAPSFGIAVFDLNADGAPDLLTGGTENGARFTLLRNAMGIFPVPGWSAFPCVAERLVVADVNGDSLPDLFASKGNTVQFILGVKGTAFPASCGSRLTPESADLVTDFALADMTGDGRLDLVVASDGPMSHVSIFADRGDSTFSSTPTRKYNFVPGLPALAVGDVLKDALPDVVFSYSHQNAISYFYNEGAGRLQWAGWRHPVGTDPQGLALADLDGDGRLDLAVANHGSNTLSVLVNRNDPGKWPFPDDGATHYQLPVGARPRAVAASDFNGDGFMDLAVIFDGDGMGLPGVDVLIATPDENVIE